MKKQTARSRPPTTLLTIVCWLALFLQTSAQGLESHKVTLSVTNQKLETVFKLIEAQVPFTFVYNASFIGARPPVTLQVKDAPLDSVLQLLTAAFHGYFELDGRNILITTPHAQPGRLTGRVMAAEAPAYNAVVRLERSGGTTVTDDNGYYSLPLPPTDDSLEVSHVSYQRAVYFIAARTSSFPVITLSENTAVLDNVTVNTGYQLIPKERATGAFSFVDNTLYNRRVSSNVLDRLEGRVPGLLFNHNTLASTSGTDINIRGHSTLYANDQPLIVLDNFPYDGDLSNLNPNDVENVTILKDAAAASIWGVRSGNGVIVITTRKGRPGQPLAIDVNTSLSVGERPNLHYSRDFLSSGDFIDIEENLFKQGYYDGTLASGYSPVTPVVQLLADARAGLISQASADGQVNQLRRVDVRDDLSRYFYRPAVDQQYNAGFRGGSERSDYFFSLGYDAGRSNLAGNSSGRFTLSGNFHFYPSKNLEFSAGMNYVSTTGYNNSPVSGINTSGEGRIYPYAQLAQPIVKDYAARWADSVAGTGLLKWQYRPLDELKYADNESRSLENRVTLGARYRLPAHVTVSLDYQYEKAMSWVNNYYSDSSYYTRNLVNEYAQPNGTGYSFPVPAGGILQQSEGALRSHHLRAQAGYQNHGKDGHSLDVIAGAEITEIIHQTSAGTIYGYDKSTGSTFSNIDFSTYYNLQPYGSALVPTIEGFGETTDHYLSYFANAAYGYKNRYTFSLSGRIDKSNLFGVRTNQKSVPLYSAGFGWDIHHEHFYHIGWMSLLKLRLTYGYNGNLDKNATAVTTIQQYSGSFYSGMPYATIVNPGNTELQWEKIRMINLGLDFTVKNDLLSGSIDYYLKKGENLFGNAPLPPSTGLTSFYGNTAATAGHGLDVQLRSNNIRRRLFSWQTGLILSWSTEKVTGYLAKQTSAQYIGYANASAIVPLPGKPIFAIYSYRWAGLDAVTGDPQGYIGKSVSKDYNGIISGTTIDSMKYDGPSRPTVFGSLSNTFSCGKFSLSFNIIFKLGYYFRKDSYLSSGMPWSGNTDYYNRWQKPGDEQHTSIPSLQNLPFDNSRDRFYQYASVLVDKGDHIRLQDISLGYDINKRWRVYGYINNVGILWRANHDGIDPDLYGADMYSFPMPRTYALGIRAKF